MTLMKVLIHLTVLMTLLIGLGGCVPEDSDATRIHDVELYGPGFNTIYGYVYGPEQTLFVADEERLATDGRSDDPLSVPGTLLLDGQPYLRQNIVPLEATPVTVERIPLTTELILNVAEDIGAVVYFDGEKWFNLLGEAEAGFNTRTAPRERLQGLRGVGDLTRDEAAVYQAALESRGPVVVTEVARTRVQPRRVDSLAEHRRTTLFVQEGLETNAGAYQPPARELTWEILAEGAQAISVENPTYQLIDTTAELLELWNRAYASRLTPPDLPEVDFRRETVLAAFMGTKPSGGYGLAVEQVRLEDAELYIDLRQQAPPAGAITTQALTSPWVMIRVLRGDIRTAWFEDVETGDLVGVARRVE